jgi:hypothetical protein
MDVQQAADGGFFVLLRGNGTDGKLVKLTGDGELEWQVSTYSGGYQIVTYAMIAMPDAGCIYTGMQAGVGTVVVRMNANGTRAWTQLYPGTGGMYFRFICPTPEGGCLILTDDSDEPNRMSFLCYNADGEPLWRRVFCNDRQDEWPLGLTPAPDGGYAVLVGSGSYRPGILKIGATGDSLWTHFTNCGTHAIPGAMCTTADDRYCVTGYRQIQEQPARYQHYLAWLNTDGVLQSVRGGDALEYTFMPNSITQASDGGYYLAGACNVTGGSSDLDIWLGRTNAAGDSIWNWYFVTAPAERLFVVRPAAEGGCIAVGYFSGGAGGTDAYVVRMGPDRISALGQPEVLSEFSLSGNYPNPFNATTTIQFSLGRESSVSLAVYDLSGRQITNLIDGRVAAGEHRIQFDGTDFASGVYFARINVAGSMRTTKMVLLK